ncbi:MAG: paraslipin, partial [Methylocystis sp.]|nr:paraslipin [Methylocystis sp.]
MGFALFIVGAVAIGLLMLDRSFNLGLPIGLFQNPLFWFAYVALLALSTMVRFVRQQTVLVIERLGRYNRREQVIDVPEQDAITKDNATVTIDGVLYYKIVNAKDAAYGAQDIRRAIINLAQTSMRSAIGSMELDKTFENRSEINERVVRAVSDAAQLWGAHVTRYEIKDIAMPESLRQSMERQMKAERDKRATVLESEGVKQSEINRAEGEKQAAILRAEGQAKAIELVRTQITQVGGDQAVQLEVAKSAIEQY